MTQEQQQPKQLSEITLAINGQIAQDALDYMQSSPTGTVPYADVTKILQAFTRMQPVEHDPQEVAQLRAELNECKAKLEELQSKPSKSNGKNRMTAVKA